MATHLSRTLLSKPTATKSLISSILSRSLSSPPSLSRSFSLLRPLSAALNSRELLQSSARSFATRPTTSSLNDQNPNWSNRPPKETILLDGCDFEHWLVVMEPPEGDPTRDEIIDSYIKTLAQVVGSEEEARMKIYSVSTRCYYAFGALVPEEVSYKIKELPRVRWVLPDSYLDVPNKNYGGEPFIDGKAVPYDPKYHEEWIRNNARAQERNRRNDRPRNNDRSRNFDRRRENMANRDGANQAVRGPGGPPPPPNYGGPPPPNYGGPRGPPPPNYNSGGPPPPPPNYNSGGPPPPTPNYSGGGPPPPPPPPGYTGGGPGGPPPASQHHYGGGPGGPPPPNYGGMPGGPPPPPPNYNMGGMPPTGNMGGMPPNAGWSNSNPGNMQHNYQNGPNNGGMAYQGPPGNYPPGNYGNN